MLFAINVLDVLNVEKKQLEMRKNTQFPDKSFLTACWKQAGERRKTSRRCAVPDIFNHYHLDFHFNNDTMI